MGLLAYRCRCGGGVHFDDHQDPVTTAAMDLPLALVQSVPATRTKHSELLDQQPLNQHHKAKVRPPLRARMRTIVGRCEPPEMHTAVNHNPSSFGDKKNNNIDIRSNISIQRRKSIVKGQPRKHQQQHFESVTDSTYARERIADSESAETPTTTPADSSFKAMRKASELQANMSSSQPLHQRPAPEDVPSTNDDNHHLLQRLTTLRRTREDKQVTDKKDQQNQDGGEMHMPRTRKPRASLQLLVRVAASMTLAPAGEEMVETECGGYDQKSSDDGNRAVTPQSQGSEGLDSQRQETDAKNSMSYIPSAYDKDEDADDEEDEDDEVWDSQIHRDETQIGLEKNTPVKTHHLSVNYYFVPRSQRQIQISQPPSPAAFRLSNGNNRFQLFDKPVIRKGCPIVSVTDPDGVVKYPDDLHYYFDEVMSDDEDDDSD